ncbi:hypothetical protein [Millisia brevis]|uniref:hypothetical protein n=1 Tax=Millisia brevis TaxID=264148 RepID=UPI00082D9B59|nr:hypothetical protein [Millisia brevis]
MITTWADARTQLSGATCLWQDLDGLHRADPPADAPATSILWAWWPDGRVARLRIDGDDVWYAQDRWDKGRRDTTIAWAADDGRIAGVRVADPATEPAAVVDEQFDVLTRGRLTYIVPTAVAARSQSAE